MSAAKDGVAQELNPGWVHHLGQSTLCTDKAIRHGGHATRAPKQTSANL